MAFPVEISPHQAELSGCSVDCVISGQGGPPPGETWTGSWTSFKLTARGNPKRRWRFSKFVQVFDYSSPSEHHEAESFDDVSNPAGGRTSLDPSVFGWGEFAIDYPTGESYRRTIRSVVAEFEPYSDDPGLERPVYGESGKVLFGRSGYPVYDG